MQHGDWRAQEFLPQETKNTNFLAPLPIFLSPASIPVMPLNYHDNSGTIMLFVPAL